MTRHLTNRFANFCTSLLLVLLVLRSPPPRAPTATTASSASRARCRWRKRSPASRPISPARASSSSSEIDQSKLAADAGIKLRPSTLLVFGNPPLGTQFITSNPNAGLDWPVRLLLTQDDNGDVWAVWTDFGWIARRHNIRDRAAQFEMATTVVGSITSTITTK